MRETNIQKAIIDYLQILENQGKLCFFRSGSGAIRTEKGGYFKTGKAGCPDISVIMPCGYIGFEVKTPNGKQTPAQEAMQNMIHCQKQQYYIVRSVDDVIKVLKGCLESEG